MRSPTLSPMTLSHWSGGSGPEGGVGTLLQGEQKKKKNKVSRGRIPNQDWVSRMSRLTVSQNHVTSLVVDVLNSDTKEAKGKNIELILAEMLINTNTPTIAFWLPLMCVKTLVTYNGRSHQFPRAIHLLSDFCFYTDLFSPSHCFLLLYLICFSSTDAAKLHFFAPLSPPDLTWSPTFHPILLALWRWLHSSFFYLCLIKVPGGATEVTGVCLPGPAVCLSNEPETQGVSLLWRWGDPRRPEGDGLH